MFDIILKEIQNNQMLTTGILVWALGVATYALKSLPELIFKKIKNLLINQIEIPSDNAIFGVALQFIAEKCKKITGNTYTLSSKGYRSGTSGTSFYWHNKIGLLAVSLSEAQNPLNNVPFRKIHISLLDPFSTKKDILQEHCSNFATESKTRDFVKIKKRFSYDDTEQKLQKITKINAIFPQHQQISDITKEFISSKEKYFNTGRAYKLGILLHGAPGTGKTTLIKLLASEFNLDIELRKLNQLTPSHDFDFSCPTIIALEDIDHDLEMIINDKEGKHATFSELLNFFDGITSPDNAIIIATTNHLDKLNIHSKSLVRPGRFDHIIEITPFTITDVFIDVPPRV